MIDRREFERLDEADPLRSRRDAFALPDGVIYLDGNSLGPLPKSVAARLQSTVDHEWREGLVRSWNAASWIDLPNRVGARIARLVGARPDEVVVADSVSVNLFKLLTGALRLRPSRPVIVSERENFPTDLYVAQGLVALLGEGYELRLVGRDEIRDRIDGRTAVLMLTEVNYRTGAQHDMAALTRAAHERGALVIWDLSHSAGAFEVDLEGAGVDFAAGCGYKFLNGGPGAPAFLYVRRERQPRFRPALVGWMGHAQPFAFNSTYAPADGVSRALAGTPPILSMSALDAALDVFDGIDMAAVGEKGRRLTAHFVDLVESRCGAFGLELLTPREPRRRGCQVSFAHDEGYAVTQALIARRVIGDFRAPNVMRFGFPALYLRYVDVFDAAETLYQVLAGREWDRPEHRKRLRVT
jgi:kynureninase